jgi:hypothetical protein
MVTKQTDNLADPFSAQIKKLRRALAGLICWAGESPDGPAWASQDAKRRNREMFEAALRAAVECFPEGHISSDDDAPPRVSLN